MTGIDSDEFEGGYKLDDLQKKAYTFLRSKKPRAYTYMEVHREVTPPPSPMTHPWRYQKGWGAGALTFLDFLTQGMSTKSALDKLVELHKVESRVVNGETYYRAL